MKVLYVVYAAVEKEIPVMLSAFTDLAQAEELARRMTEKIVDARALGWGNTGCFPESGSPSEKARTALAYRTSFHIGEVPLIEPGETAETAVER